LGGSSGYRAHRGCKVEGSGKDLSATSSTAVEDVWCFAESVEKEREEKAAGRCEMHTFNVKGRGDI
jgi:hypothetical protein